MGADGAEAFWAGGFSPRSFPRKREPRTTCSGCGFWLWVPACAGTDGDCGTGCARDAGCGLAGLPSPAITATTAPTGATSPTRTRISDNTPVVVDGTSI